MIAYSIGYRQSEIAECSALGRSDHDVVADEFGIDSYTCVYSDKMRFEASPFWSPKMLR